MGKTLYHVSFERVESFTPRIPPCRLRWEDAATPRICFCDSIKHCINAKPSGAKCLAAMIAYADHLKSGRHEVDPEVVLHLYVAEDQGEGAFLTPEQLAACHGVLDAQSTGEHWALSTPHLKHQTIRVLDAAFGKMVDADGKDGLVLKTLVYEPCQEQQNYLEEVRSLNAELAQYSIDDLLMAIYDEEAIRKMVSKIKTLAKK